MELPLDNPETNPVDAVCQEVGIEEINHQREFGLG
jgi:hypothetical protein